MSVEHITNEIGRVVPLHKGDYNSGTIYDINDIVSYHGSTYWKYVINETAGILPTDTSVWRLVTNATDVEPYVEQAIIARNEAVAAQAAAETARDAASTYANNASTSADNAEAASGAASAQADIATEKASEAATSKAGADAALSDAISAKNDAINAKTGAETAMETAVEAKNTALASATSAYTSEVNAAASASASSTSETNAAASATSASNSASTATSAASTAESAKSAAQTAQTAAEAAQALAETAQHSAEEAAEEAVTTLANKANIDGYYVDLTAGSAEQLLSTVQITDKVPYNFRTSGGSADIGNRLTDKIVGGTICWNQLCNHGNFDDVSGWSALNGTLSVADGIASFTATAAGGSLGRSIYMTYGHRYILSAEVKTTTETDQVCLQTTRNTNLPKTFTVPSTNWQTIQRIYTRSGATQNVNFGIRDNRTSDWDEVQVRNYVMYDLTAMFGTTIADYIYSLETANEGDGIKWFRNLFPKDYYAYNAGEMLSVNVSSHDTVGFNAYDNASGKARLIGGMEYQITGAYTALSYSTGETITPDANGYFTPSESGELTVTGGNSTDTCVHLVWDGEKDGEFEEYNKHSYPLDSSLTLRGVPILDANNKLYYDGDIYESDGTVKRRAVQITLNGSEVWAQSGSPSPTALGRYFYTKIGALGSVIDLTFISSKYQRGDLTGSGRDIGMTVVNSSARGQAQIGIRPEDAAEMTLAQFKALLAADPVTVVYLLKDSYAAVEEAAPFTSPQIIDDFGTEEYVDYAYSQGTRDVAIPVGHDTLYMNNLRAKLEMSPDSPDGDGDYIVRQSGGENVYVPLTKELPAAPSEDGNYVLKVTVSDGTPTYSWEAQT